MMAISLSTCKPGKVRRECEGVHRDRGREGGREGGGEEDTEREGGREREREEERY